MDLLHQAIKGIYNDTQFSLSSDFQAASISVENLIQLRFSTVEMKTRGQMKLRNRHILELKTVLHLNSLPWHSAVTWLNKLINPDTELYVNSQ